jgi:uncharacterized protein (DUF1697 family)
MKNEPRRAASSMSTFVAFLRGINVGGKQMIRMEKLRGLCEAAGFHDVRTHLQSGNVLVRSSMKDAASVGRKLADVIEKSHGFRIEVMVRTIAELQKVVEQSPISPAGRNPSALVVVFFHETVPTSHLTAVEDYRMPDEELRAKGRELYGYFPNGLGTSKLAARLMGKGGPLGTARNWNTVTRMLELASAGE